MSDPIVRARHLAQSDMPELALKAGGGTVGDAGDAWNVGYQVDRKEWHDEVEWPDPLMQTSSAHPQGLSLGRSSGLVTAVGSRGSARRRREQLRTSSLCSTYSQR